ncbi:MAG: hypothetical protein JO234_07480, partial [Hyphomicrobiales bacterium]|nr:hypothetical protein [Hyphomicrobiales bacterium]
YPDHERIVLTNIPVASMAAPLISVLGPKLAHRAIAYPTGARDPRVLLDLRRRLRDLETREMIYLMPSRGMVGVYRDLAFFRLCGFQTPVGIPWTPDLDRVRILPNGELEPECERIARALAALGPFDLTGPAAWDLHLDAAERAAGKATAGSLAEGPFLAVNMGGKAAQKDWGVDNWRALLARIALRFPGMGLLVVGAAEDVARAPLVCGGWRGPIVNACGKLAPRVSAAAMLGARLFLGHDSGPLHLASAIGLPCVGLFGDFNRPRAWHPYRGDNRILHDMRGVRAITVDQAFGAVMELLR